MKKLQKNHHNIAAHIGHYWGDQKDIKGNRCKKIYYLDLMSYLSTLSHNNNQITNLSSFIKEDKTAEEVSYSKIYLKETEENLKDISNNEKKVSEIEKKFLNSINNYLNPKSKKQIKIPFKTESIQNSMRDYISLQLLRTPLHYAMMHEEHYNNSDILHFHKMIELNNYLMQKYFPNNHNLLKNYEFFDFNIEDKNREIFLGNLTALTKNSIIFHKNITEYLEEENICIEKIADLTNFVIFPMTSNKIIVGFDNTNKETEIINFFNENLSHIVDFWNISQIMTSYEVIVTEKTKFYIDSYLSYTPENPKKILAHFQNHIDYLLNTKLDNNQIHTITEKYEQWKNDTLQIYNKNQPCDIKIEFLPHQLDCVIEKLHIDIFFNINNASCRLIHDFEIDSDGCIFINENNQMKLFCYNFYCFFSTLLSFIEQPRVAYLNGKPNGYASFNFLDLRESSFFLEIKELTKKIYEEAKNIKDKK